jgi:hypothetical protein
MKRDIGERKRETIDWDREEEREEERGREREG